MDSHAAMQSEQHFRLTACVNLGLLRVSRGCVQSLEPHATVGSSRSLVFDGKSGGSELACGRKASGQTGEALVERFHSGIGC